MVTVLFFAQLREQLQCEKTSVEFRSVLNVADLREHLVSVHPHWSEFLRSDKLLCSVNQVLTKSSHPVNDGDEVAFFPPVTGG